MSLRQIVLAGGWVLLSALGVNGCVGNHGATIPEERFFRLPDPQPQPAAARFHGTVAVALPRADGLHSERAVLYSRQDRPLEILRHHYYFWAESPPRLIQTHLIEFLRAAHVADAVVRAEVGDAGTLRIETRLLRFERLLGPAPAVVVALEMSVQHPGAGTDVPRPVYRARVPVDDDTMYGSLQAFDKALETIYRHFLADLPAD